MEIWKDIKGYEGLYQVSNYGNIKRLARCQLDGRHLKEKLFNLNVSGDGYIMVGLTKNKQRTMYYVHRLVAEQFIPHEKDKYEVDHIDTDRTNNHVDNLRWVTRSENNLNPLTRIRLGHEKGKTLSEEHKRKISIARRKEI